MNVLQNNIYKLNEQYIKIFMEFISTYYIFYLYITYYIDVLHFNEAPMDSQKYFHKFQMHLWYYLPKILVK